MEAILMRLMEHYQDCEAYYNELVENDADYHVKERAMARLNGVEECIQIIRRLRDGDYGHNQSTTENGRQIRR